MYEASCFVLRRFGLRRVSSGPFSNANRDISVCGKSSTSFIVRILSSFVQFILMPTVYKNVLNKILLETLLNFFLNRKRLHKFVQEKNYFNF